MSCRPLCIDTLRVDASALAPLLMRTLAMLIPIPPRRPPIQVPRPQPIGDPPGSFHPRPDPSPKKPH